MSTYSDITKQEVRRKARQNGWYDDTDDDGLDEFTRGARADLRATEAERDPFDDPQEDDDE